MQEHLEFDPAYTMLTLALAPGEAVKSEPGAMVCQSGVEMTIKKYAPQIEEVINVSP